MSRIVLVLYRNCGQVIHGFGLIRSLLCSLGFADPMISTFSFDICRALASIAERTSSDSYSFPFHDVKCGRYAVKVSK